MLISAFFVQVMALSVGLRGYMHTPDRPRICLLGAS